MTRLALDAAGLRRRGKDAAAARRMLARALVLEGQTRSAGARGAGMDRQTLRGWVHRYNERGLAGLANLPDTGAPPRKLTEAQEVAVAAWVRQGPTPERHKVVRWRRIDLRDKIGLFRTFGAVVGCIMQCIGEHEVDPDLLGHTSDV
jgi:transposase